VRRNPHLHLPSPPAIYRTVRDVAVTPVLAVAAMGTDSRLGGVVVSVLAIVPKDRGFKTGRGDALLSAIKILNTPSFGWEVNPEVPCKILWHVKNPLRYFRY
jgi:hypothetical protein